MSNWWQLFFVPLHFVWRSRRRTTEVVLTGNKPWHFDAGHWPFLASRRLVNARPKAQKACTCEFPLFIGKPLDMYVLYALFTALVVAAVTVSNRLRLVLGERLSSCFWKRPTSDWNLTLFLPRGWDSSCIVLQNLENQQSKKGIMSIKRKPSIKFQASWTMPLLDWVALFRRLTKPSAFR